MLGAAIGGNGLLKQRDARTLGEKVGLQHRDNGIDVCLSNFPVVRRESCEACCRIGDMFGNQLAQLLDGQ